MRCDDSVEDDDLARHFRCVEHYGSEVASYYEIFIFQNPNLDDCTLNLTFGTISGAGNGAGCTF